MVRHETTHAQIATVPGRVPTWLNEGLAEWFERSGEGVHLLEQYRWIHNDAVADDTQAAVAQSAGRQQV